MKLLVSVDLSDSSKTVIQKTKALASALSAEVWFLHVADPEPDFVGYDIDPKTGRDSLSKTYHTEHCQIQGIAEDCRSDGIKATALLVQGATVEKILSEADKLEVDMIIVGSHGRGAMYQVLVGSVSEGVIHSSGRPVLVVPTHKRD